MAFCTECGTNVPDDVKFCTSCGKPIKAVPKMDAAAQEAAARPSAAAYSLPPGRVAAAYSPPPGQTAAAYSPPPGQAAAAYSPPPVPAAVTYGSPPGQAAADTTPLAGSRYAVMSTGAFILLSILFAIPLIGQIACIIMAFGAKNLNRRNFARATLIFMIIGLVISVVLYFVGRWVLEAAASYLSEAGGFSPSPDELVELLGLLDGMAPGN